MTLPPTAGRWIQWYLGSGHSGDREFKCQVLSYETVDGHTTLFGHGGAANISQSTQETYATVRYEDGTEDSLSEEDLERYNWTYCEAPDQEQLEKAKYQQLNMEIGDRSCAKCGCSSKKLQICTGCHKEYYCDATCQKAHREKHKDFCTKEKIVLKPNPRYPLAQVSNFVKANQVKIQTEHNQLLQDSLAGNFTMQHTGSFFFQPPSNDASPIHNPKSGSDLESSERYKLVINNQEFNFKWRGLETSGHSIPENQPISCTTLQYMEMTLNETEFIKGGLHYLAGSGDDTFWYMLINFNTFGTVAPFNGGCHCNPGNVKGQMPPKLRALRKKWDRIFKRAKADKRDVQCMYTETEEGCHNYNDCPYKHDIETEEEQEGQGQELKETEEEKTKRKQKKKKKKSKAYWMD